MIFSLAIYSSPASPSSDSAYRFAQSVLQQGHQLYRVFFYHDGVYQSSSLNTPPQDEINITEQWQTLSQAHDVDLVVCIAAGLRRGIMDQQKASRYEKNASNLAEKFELSGLGQLVDATIQSDRLITFGG